MIPTRQLVFDLGGPVFTSLLDQESATAASAAYAGLARWIQGVSEANRKTIEQLERRFAFTAIALVIQIVASIIGLGARLG